MATMEEFVAAARKAGRRAQIVPPRGEDAPGVNVWKDPDDRAPDTTVWWPRASHPNDGIVWGHHFEYSTFPHIPADTLVEMVWS